MKVFLFGLALFVCSGCASSRYYPVDRQQDNTDYANRMECPGDTLPVCQQRGGEIINCRCAHDTELGDIIL